SSGGAESLYLLVLDSGTRQRISLPGAGGLRAHYRNDRSEFRTRSHLVPDRIGLLLVRPDALPNPALGRAADVRRRLAGRSVHSILSALVAWRPRGLSSTATLGCAPLLRAEKTAQARVPVLRRSVPRARR